MTVRPDIAASGTPTTVENADVTVIGGAGHVGIPLVLALAEAGLRVNVNDLNKESLDTLEAGRLPFIEHGADSVLSKALINKRLIFTHSSDRISTGGPVIVTIGTPIDEFLNPSMTVFERTVEQMFQHVQPGTLVVLRSTVYPGTSEFMAAAFAARSCDVQVAFCPERIA